MICRSGYLNANKMTDPMNLGNDLRNLAYCRTDNSVNQSTGREFTYRLADPECPCLHVRDILHGIVVEVKVKPGDVVKFEIVPNCMSMRLTISSVV
jgi:hypothetical protein